MQQNAGGFEPGQLRASHADRERVATVLNQALAEGRLSLDELQERLDTVYAAKTLAELEPVTKDLPGHTPLVPKTVQGAATAGARGRDPEFPTGRVAGQQRLDLDHCRRGDVGCVQVR